MKDGSYRFLEIPQVENDGHKVDTVDRVDWAPCRTLSNFSQSTSIDQSNFNAMAAQASASQSA